MSASRERNLFEGLVAGVLAYLAVALVFAGADLLLGRAVFATPAAIGGILFYGAHGPLATVSAGPVAAANGVHILLSVAIGLVAALVVEETERHPQFFYATFFVVVAFLFASTAVLLGIPSAITRAAPWAVILVANVVGLAVAGAYLWHAHPALRRSVDELGGGEEHASAQM